MIPQESNYVHVRFYTMNNEYRVTVYGEHQTIIDRALSDSYLMGGTEKWLKLWQVLLIEFEVIESIINVFTVVYIFKRKPGNNNTYTTNVMVKAK